MRQLLVATGNIFTYTLLAVLPRKIFSLLSRWRNKLTETVVLFPTYDAPNYKYGYQILILFGGLAIAGVVLLKYSHKPRGS